MKIIKKQMLQKIQPWEAMLPGKHCGAMDGTGMDTKQNILLP